ncbi:hypothetical protein GGI43DRAFT_382807 [Trichoderma evansii]
MIWSQFPPEIKCMILEALTDDKNCILSNAAVVSREWQAVIEPHIFAYIRVTSQRIAQLNAMPQRNRDHSLFTALNTWEPNGSLTLYISLYSKSDNEHAFKYLTFMPDATGHQVEPMSIAGSEEPNKHRWETTVLGSIPPERSLERLFGHVWLPIKDERKCWAQTPKVLAVTRLEMRLQTYRRWETFTVSQILSHLPGLPLLELLSATEGLGKLTIFENSNQEYPLYFLGEPGQPMLPLFISVRSLPE